MVISSHRRPRPITVPRIGIASRVGFTLIELLIVVAIIATLMGILLPAWGLMSRTAKRYATLAVLNKTEAALTRYRGEFKAYPHQLAYPDTDPVAPFAASNFVNRLSYQVGTSMAAADMANIRADMDAATKAYTYNEVLEQNGESSSAAYLIDWNSSELSAAPLAIHAYQVLWEPSYATQSQGGNAVHRNLGNPNSLDGNARRMSGHVPTAMVVNRLLQERARRAMLTGYVTITGTRAILPSGLDGGLNPVYPDRTYANAEYDQRTTRVVGNPLSVANSVHGPGWAIDYFGDKLEKRFRKGDAIVDAWGNPLIYVHQLSPGIAMSPYTYGCVYADVYPFDTRFYGMRSQPAWPADLPITKAAMEGIDGRFLLSATNCGWGVPTPTNETYFPDLTKLLDSDVRYYAAEGYTREFELWSAGADGLFSWRRSTSVNRDNVAARPYNQGLP